MFWVVKTVVGRSGPGIELYLNRKDDGSYEWGRLGVTTLVFSDEDSAREACDRDSWSVQVGRSE